MTHDEWISDLNKYIAVAEIATPATAQLVKALRAVVELHKPQRIPDWVPVEHKDKYVCEICPGFYPCKTIRAIEKECNSNAV